jgi:hypothetical protein
MERYEAGWQKNPFTLKTAPAPPQRENWAKDLVLGGVSTFDSGDRLEVVVVNSKTHQRTKLNNKNAVEGMIVKSVDSHAIHNDTTAVVEMKDDQFQPTATLKYDDTVLKSMAGAPNGVPPVPGVPGLPGTPVPGRIVAPPMPQPATAPGGRPMPYGVPPRGSMTPGAPVPSTIQPVSPSTVPTPIRRRQLLLPNPVTNPMATPVPH